MTSDPWWMTDNIDRRYYNVQRGVYTEEELWFVVRFNRDWGLSNVRRLWP